MWNCVEDRVGSDKYGRVIRKIIFDDIYADRIAVLSQNPISRAAHPHLKSGDKVVFYDNCEIKEGNFLLSSEQRANLDPKSLIGEVLTSEDEIRNFCNSYGLMKRDTTLNSLVIEAYLFLEKKLKCKERLLDNTGSPRVIARKRPSAACDPQNSNAKASRMITAMATQNLNFNITPPAIQEPHSPEDQVTELQDEIPITKIQLDNDIVVEPSSPPSVNNPLMENIGANNEESPFFINQPPGTPDISSPAVKVEPGITSSQSTVVAKDEEIEILDCGEDDEEIITTDRPSGTGSILDGLGFNMDAIANQRNADNPNPEICPTVQFPTLENMHRAGHAQSNPTAPYNVSGQEAQWALMQMNNLRLQNQNPLQPWKSTNPKPKVNYGTKLTDKQRIEIIRLFDEQKISKAQLGSMFSVSSTAIYKIIKDKNKWKQRLQPESTCSISALEDDEKASRTEISLNFDDDSI